MHSAVATTRALSRNAASTCRAGATTEWRVARTIRPEVVRDRNSAFTSDDLKSPDVCKRLPAVDVAPVFVQSRFQRRRYGRVGEQRKILGSTDPGAVTKLASIHPIWRVRHGRIGKGTERWGPCWFTRVLCPATVHPSPDRRLGQRAYGSRRRCLALRDGARSAASTMHCNASCGCMGLN